MKFLSSITLVLISLIPLSLQAQNEEPCGHNHYIDALDKISPGYKSQLESQYKEAINAINSRKLSKRESDTIYRIPVVFHIIYNNDNENIDDSLIHSQMDVLNACFRRKNEDTINTREIFKPIAGDTKIEFYLATEDEQGNPTNGIHRKETNKQTFYNFFWTTSLDEVKKTSTGGTDPWDTDKYLNIWVCDMSYNGQASLLGYAFPPVNASGWQSNAFLPKERQGVVLHYGVVGVGNPFDNVNNSTGPKTAVHEVGHFLGLRHIWGDGQQGTNGCLVDDFLDDTPNTYSRSTSCNKNRNTCREGADDMPDMIENYMDYSPGTCTNMFTQQQADLMLYNLINLRAGLAETVAPEIPIIYATRNVIYPVPSENEITLELMDVDPTKDYTLSFTNTIGQLLFEKSRTLDTEKSVIDVSFLKSGVYFFEVKDGDSILFFQKMVVY